MAQELMSWFLMVAKKMETLICCVERVNGAFPQILAGVVMLWCAVIGTATSTYASDPTVVVKETINEVIRLVKDNELKKPTQVSQRRMLIEQAIGKHFSFSEMAKRSLAAHWKDRCENERQEFVQLFQTLLSKTYAGKIETYSGEEVQYLKERRKNSFAEVQTKVISQQTEISLDYRLIQKDTTWFVYDVVVNGVSLIKNYRSQFARIIHRSSYEELVTTLREKSSEITAP